MAASAWDFSRRAHRIRWWIGYYLAPPWRSAYVCELVGHKRRRADYEYEVPQVPGVLWPGVAWWCARCTAELDPPEDDRGP